MGKGGKLLPEIDPQVRQQEFTWDEVRAHRQRDDTWMVIDGYVYDISTWAKKHPGGSSIIRHYAGQDASEAFQAFHNDLKYVRKYLGAVRIGRIMPDGPEKELEIQRDFRLLRETAEKMGLFQPSACFFILVIAQIFLLEILAYYNLVYFGTGWFSWLVTVFLLTTAQVQVGWTQHDFGHRSVFHNTFLDQAVHQLLVGFQKGTSADWWNHLHFQHHSKPNVIKKDPDIRMDAVLVIGNTMAKRAAKEKTRSLPYNFQHRYFYAFSTLLFPLYFQIMIIRHPITRRKYFDLFMLSLFYIRYLSMYVPHLGVTWAVLTYFIVRALEGNWFVWVTQMNHIPMEIDDDKERPWLALQLYATCNVDKSAFNDWFTGHLNHQIEHHLFPTMPRHNLYKISSLARSLCEKHNIPYICKPLLTAFGDILRALEKTGSVWKSHYDAFHHK